MVSSVELGKAVDELLEQLDSTIQVAVTLATELGRPEGRIDLSDVLTAAYDLRENTSQVELLVAAILNRCGASWDALGQVRGESRQSIHRRLSAIADQSWSNACENPEDHSGQFPSLERALEAVNGPQVKVLRSAALRRLQDPRGFVNGSRDERV